MESARIKQFCNKEFDSTKYHCVSATGEKLSVAEMDNTELRIALCSAIDQITEQHQLITNTYNELMAMNEKVENRLYK